MLKKIGALLLALAMVMSLSVGAMADSSQTLTDGVIGVFGEDDKPVSKDKTIQIAKELTVYNVKQTSINAPTISFTYKITAGPAGVAVTDAAGNHANSTPVTVTTKDGVTEGLKVNGTAGTKGTIAWTYEQTVAADTEGKENYKYLTIDFSGVKFGAAGVYRYTITESLTGVGATYAESGVTATNNTTNPHVRYLDVYVRPAPNGFIDGTNADDWDIYGYVCLVENEPITPEGDTSIKGAVKTNGFVAGTNDGTPYTADSYYTYNVTVTKSVTNDEYAKATHAFPFTVLFTNGDIKKTVDISYVKKGTPEGFVDPPAAALAAGNTKGILRLKDSQGVTYIGIPNGTKVEVYETNDMYGVTYQVTTKIDGSQTVTDKAVTSVQNAPSSATHQGSSTMASQSTATTITPKKDADDDTDHTIELENNLQVISPTGVALRIAPYVLILGAGLALLLISRRRKAAVED